MFQSLQKRGLRFIKKGFSVHYYINGYRLVSFKQLSFQCMTLTAQSYTCLCGNNSSFVEWNLLPNKCLKELLPQLFFLCFYPIFQDIIRMFYLLKGEVIQSPYSLYNSKLCVVQWQNIGFGDNKSKVKVPLSYQAQ